MMFNQIYSSRSVSNIGSKYDNSITNLFPILLLMLKYLLFWNNYHIIYDVVSFYLKTNPNTVSNFELNLIS